MFVLLREPYATIQVSIATSSYTVEVLLKLRTVVANFIPGKFGLIQ